MGVLELTLVSIVIIAASFFNTVSGFGFALVAMPFLAELVGPKAAVVFIMVASSCMRAIMLWRTRKDFEFNIVAVAAMGSLIGVVPGTYFLKVIDSADLKIFLGIVLLIAVFLMKNEFKLPIKNMTLGRFSAGALCGFFSAATSVGGPPLALWFVNENMSKEKMRGNLVWTFAFSGIFTLIGLFLAGTTNSVGDWTNLLYILPSMLLGLKLGEIFFTKINKHLFDRIVLLIILFGALSALASGILAKNIF